MLRSLKPKKERLLYKLYEYDGIKIIAVKNKYSNYMSYSRRMISFFKFMLLSSWIALKERNIDIIFATSTPLTVAVPALIVNKIKKVPYVFEVRDLWPEAPIQLKAIKSPLLIKLLRKFELMVYKNSRHIIALSPGMEEGILKTGVDKNKVTMIPNCSDLDLFNRHSLPDKDLIDKYQLKDKFIVLHAGSMGVANGLDYIIEAARLLGNDSNIVFILAGDGSQRPFLSRLCEQYGLSNVIMTGPVPRKLMPQYFALSNITITSFANIPILSTNSPNKFFDSLAAGKPVIVNSPGWTKDLVLKYNIGFYVDPEKPSELAKLLLELKENKYDLEEMGKRARELAETQYNRITLASKLEAVLQKVYRDEYERKVKPR